jgi:hypothetical protein
VGVPVGEVGRSAHAEHFCPLLVDCLQDPCIQDWGLGSGIDSNEEDGVCVFDGLDLRVEEVIRPEVAGQGEGIVGPELVIEAIEGVEEVLEGLDVFDALELSDSRCDVLAIHLVDPR